MRTHFKSLQRAVAAIALAVVGFVSVGASSAHAVEEYVFGYTFSGFSRQLILNGGETVLEATNGGWYSNDGNTDLPGNTNYLVGQTDGLTHRNFFTFDLSSVTGTITSAVLSLYNPSIGFAGNSKTFVIHDVTSIIPALISNVDSVATYNGIGAGTVIGSKVVDSSSADTDVLVNLNPFALAALNSLVGNGSFGIGGTIGVSAVPLPAALPMFGFAVAGLFGAARRKKIA